MSKKHAISASILALVATVLCLTVCSQKNRLDQARKHASALQTRIEGEERFADITFGGLTGAGGCMGIFGSVTSREDVVALSNLVVRSACPVPVVWRVRVR